MAAGISLLVISPSPSGAEKPSLMSVDSGEVHALGGAGGQWTAGNEEKEWTAHYFVLLTLELKLCAL